MITIQTRKITTKVKINGKEYIMILKIWLDGEK